MLRLAARFLALIALALLASGIYLQRNLDGIVATGARAFLQQHGVTTIELSGFALAADRVAVDRLVLHGELAGTAFSATLRALSVSYHWRRLLEGRVESIALRDALLRACPGADADPPQQGPLDLTQLLPLQSLSQLPLQSAEIAHWRLDYCPETPGALAASGSARLADDALEIDGTSEFGGLTLSASAALAPRAETVALQAGATRAGTRLVTLRAEADIGPGDTAWQWSVRAGLEFAPLLDWLRDESAAWPSMAGFVAPTGVAAGGALTIAGTVHHPTRIDPDTAFAEPLGGPFSGSLAIGLAIDRAAYPDVLDAARGSVDSSLDFAPHDWQLRVGPGSTSALLHTALLPLDDSQRAWLGWDAPPALEIHWQSAAVTLQGAGPATLEIVGAAVEVGDSDSKLRASELELHASLADLGNLPRRLTLDAGLEGTLQGHSLPPLSLALQQTHAAGRSLFEFALADAGGTLNLTARGELSTDTGAGSGQLELTLPDLPALVQTALPLLDGFGAAVPGLSLTGGSASLSTEVHGRSPAPRDWQQTSTLAVAAVAGSLDGITFSGLDLDAHWRGIEKWQTLRPVELGVQRLDAGIELRNLRAALSLPQPTPPAAGRFTVESLAAELLGGDIRLAQPAAWDLGAARNGLTLRAQGLSLAELVALQQSDDIAATGELVGELPVALADGRLVIDDGSLRALPPGGKIRYTPDATGRALSAGDDSMQMVTDLLRDFDYDILGSEVALNQRGILRLQISLGGSNPAVQSGRRVEFNIGLEQNVDPLLEGLRLGGELLERIETGAQ